MNNIHKDHRSRMKNRYKETGFNGFSDHEILELLLFYGIPNGDVNPLAHRLLDRFSNISTIMDAPIEALTSVNGVGEHTALLLKLIPDLCRKYMLDKNNPSKNIYLSNTAALGEFVRHRFIGVTQEQFYAIFLDNNCKVIKHGVMFEGGINAVHVNFRSIAEAALGCQATCVAFAHNHPKASAKPSIEDARLTVQLANTLKPLGIEIVDHIIVSDTEYVSLRHYPEYKKIFE